MDEGVAILKVKYDGKIRTYKVLISQINFSYDQDSRPFRLGNETHYIAGKITHSLRLEGNVVECEVGENEIAVLTDIKDMPGSRQLDI
jgi:hypothetical protein